jgi:predicted Rossmann fold nucleotide-binding protein DprA/Smf involved in DNA uptake
MTDMNLEPPPLSPDTEAILLLCGRFGSERGEQTSPLAQKQYEALTRWLLERNLRPADLLNADSSLLVELVQAKLDHTTVSALLRRGTALALAMEKWRRSGLWVLSRSDSAYPKRLKKKLGQSAPPLLYGAGDAGLLDSGGVAIVGSRDVSESGLSFTQELAQACVRDGMGVVSGGAKGVDAAAMQACGEAGGIVIGVLAADLLRATVNRQNRQGIQAGQLVLISPFSPEAGFNAGNAMARNRYIYALADVAVVVDSAEGDGGTWTGAIEDIRHEWTPLYVRDPGDKPGNRALIAKGARSFTYSFEGRDSIKAYLTPDQQVFGPATLYIAPAIVPVAVEEPKIIESAEVAEPLVADRHTADQAEPKAVETELVGGDFLDMFPVFLERLSAVLGPAARTEEEIRVALGLNKSQVKIWLAAAVSDAKVVKLKKPIAYAMPKQKTLC